MRTDPTFSRIQKFCCWQHRADKQISNCAKDLTPDHAAALRMAEQSDQKLLHNHGKLHSNVPLKKSQASRQKAGASRRSFCFSSQRTSKKELPMLKTKDAIVNTTKKPSAPAHHNWNLPENFPALKTAAIANLNRE